MPKNKREWATSDIILHKFSYVFIGKDFVQIQTPCPSLCIFSTIDLNGGEVSQSIFHDEKPILGDIAREYIRKGMHIVGIVVDVQKAHSAAIDESKVAAARQAVEKANAGYMHLLPSNDLIAGVLKSVTQIPVKIFVESGGTTVGEMVEGARSYHEWVNIIDRRMKMIS